MTKTIITADYIRALQGITPAIMAAKPSFELVGYPTVSRQTINILFEAADRVEVVYEGVTGQGAYNAVIRRVEYGDDTQPDLTDYFLARLE